MSDPKNTHAVDAIAAVNKGHSVEREVTDVFSALDSPRRVRLLSVLWEADGQLSLPTAVERTVARERAGERTNGSDRSNERVRVSFRHVHLQKLSAAGLIAVDDAEERIRLTVESEHLRAVLDSAARLTQSV
ncbi:DUF7344 domain-containing protein [Halorientalis halophila]|uniref:DUF7344 domain-containing protein n=1 Tax=Halorientalis halophila TaxID=3108499 RepID=UPI00300AA1F1